MGAVDAGSNPAASVIPRAYTHVRLAAKVMQIPEFHTPDGRVLHGTARVLVFCDAPVSAAVQAFLLPDTQKPDVPVGSAVRLFLNDPRAPSAAGAS